MGVIWRNTLRASKHCDAEKVLAYADNDDGMSGFSMYDIIINTTKCLEESDKF